jgi:hypothetical protein
MISSSGFGPGPFSIVIPNLSEGVTYFVKSYSVNGLGTSYSDEKSFKTLINNAPIVTTGNPDTIQVYNANCYGAVTDQATSPILERGFCWSLSPNPNINSSNKVNSGTGTGQFKAKISGLSPGTKYYVKAFARNNTSVGYGEEKSFTTFSIPTITGQSEVSFFQYSMRGTTYTFYEVGYSFYCSNPGVSPISYGSLSGQPGQTLSYPEDVSFERGASEFPIFQSKEVQYGFNPSQIRKLFVKTNIGVFLID